MTKRLLIVTTVPETLVTILKDQPRFLSRHYDVVLATSFGCELAELATENVPVYVVPMRRGISPVLDLISVFRMCVLMLKLQPDIVHSYTPKAGLVCMLAACVCRVPFRVHTFTGLIWPTANGWRQRLLKAIDRVLCACATHIIPEGCGVLRDLKTGQITSKPLCVIGHGNIAGVNIEYFSTKAKGLDVRCKQLRQHFGIDDGHFVFVFVGRLNCDKGIDELLAAFVKLPEHSRLLIVGGLDESAPISGQALHVLETHPRVHWMGFQQDIRPSLVAADVLVLPSYREGFPNVLLQAGAMELAVIATDISGCNEVVTPHLNGWLVPVKNSAALAISMRYALLTPPSILIDMGRAARQRVVERFERTSHWNRMLTYYHSLTNKIRA